jgi:fibronectin-binding autotransporter adhesin
MCPRRFPASPVVAPKLKRRLLSSLDWLEACRHRRAGASRLLLLLVVMRLPTAIARGAEIYWDGLSGGWDVVANWSTSAVVTEPNPAAPPGAADRANFTIPSITAPTVGLNGPRTVTGLYFSVPATINAGNAGNQTLTIGAAGITATGFARPLVLIGQPGQMVNIVLSAPQTWKSDDNLTISGTITNIGHTLTLDGNSNGSILLAGAIGPGPGGITKIGAGRATLGALNSYSGVTSILEGTLALAQPAPANNIGALGAATSAVLLGATTGSANATLESNGNVGRDLVVRAGNTGLISLTGVGSNFAGTITLHKNLNLLGSTSATGVATISGVITGSGGLTKNGAGIFALTNANTFTGPVSATNGSVQISHPDALGLNPTVTMASGTNTGGTLELRGNHSFGAGKTLVMATSGAFSSNPRLHSAGGRNTWAAPVSITGGGTVLFHGSTASELVVAGTVMALDAAASAEIRMSGSGLVTFEQNITAPARTFWVSAGGTVVVRGADNDWKATHIQSGSVRVEASGALPYAPLTFGALNDFNSTGQLDLAGTNQAIAGWEAFFLNSSNRVHSLRNSSAVNASILSVAAKSTSLFYTEIQSGAGITIEKEGTGYLDFVNSLPRRASFAIEEGDLRFTGVGTTVILGSITGVAGAKFSSQSSTVVVAGSFDHLGTTEVGQLMLGAGRAGTIQVNGTLGVGIGEGRLTAETVNFGISAASNFAPVLGTLGGEPLLTATNVTVVGTEVLVQPRGAAFSIGTYPLLRSTNGTIGGAGFAAFTMGAPGTYPHMTATLEHDAVNARIDLHVTAVDSLIWTGAMSGDWSVSGAENFRLASDGTSAPFYQSDRVLFNDTGANKIITLAGVLPQVQMGNLTFNNSVGNDYTIRGGLNGVGGVTKLGTGTVTLDAESSSGDPSFHRHAFTGLTVVNEGTLILRGRNTGGGSMIIPGGSLDVRGTLPDNEVFVSGGTLRGTGITGPVTLESGTIAPGLITGTGVGTLTTGSLVLSGGGMVFDIAGPTAADLVTVIGLVKFEGDVELTLNFPSYNPTNHVDVFTLVLNDEADLIVHGGFGFSWGGVLLDEGAIFTATGSGGAQVFQLSYAGGSGNDVVLRAIPEPASALTILLGIGTVLARRRRFDGIR